VWAFLAWGGSIRWQNASGSDTFLPLREYPYESRRKKGDYSAIVELTVDYKVPDIVDLTVKVDHMIGETVLETLFER
jgi:hypothetical protein